MSSFLNGGGEAGALMRGLDWSTSVLGPSEAWPQPLRSAVALMLGSKFPMFVAWGPELGFVYNDAYAEILGAKHPAAMGARFQEVWSEIWPDISPLIEATMAGDAVWREDLPLLMNRKGFDEQTWFTFSYSPLRDEEGEVCGMFCAVQETTQRVLADRAVKDSEARLRLALEAGRMAVFEYDAAAGGVVASPELNRMLGYEPSVQLDVREASARYFPGDWDRLVAAALKALETGERFFQAEFRFRRADDGALRWFLLRGEIVPDPAGAPPRTVGVLLDITDRKQVEADLDAALAAGKLALFDYDHVLKTFRPSPRLNEIYGFPPDHALTRDDVRSRYHPDDMAQIVARARRDDADPSVREFEWIFRLQWPGGPSCWVEGRGEYVRDERGRILRSRGVVMDVTERMLWEERQRLLMNELNHRVKNTLAVVQGLAHQTFRGSASIAEARPIFEARLAALSATHDLLTRRSWQAAPLRQIVEASVQGPAGAAAARVSMDGPEVSLSPQSAVSFALAVHELTTNAVKYGALSAEGGKVTVSWSVGKGRDGPRLDFRWEERGGPPVGKPTRRGFGTRLIQDALARELGGEVWLDFRPEGLLCLIEAQLIAAA